MANKLQSLTFVHIVKVVIESIKRSQNTSLYVLWNIICKLDKIQKIKKYWSFFCKKYRFPEHKPSHNCDVIKEEQFKITNEIAARLLFFGVTLHHVFLWTPTLSYIVTGCTYCKEILFDRMKNSKKRNRPRKLSRMRARF